MGSFIGHVVPGSFFGIFALWWTWAIFHRFFSWQRSVSDKNSKGEWKGTPKWRNTISFNSSCCPRVPMEGIIKIIAVILGMTGEFVTGFKNGQFEHIGNAQHMTMFFFFGLNGVIDVMTQCKVAVPQNLDYMSGIMAFAMEALIFAYHLKGRSSMDVQVHTLLVYLIIAGIIATACEMTYKSHVLPCFARIFFTLLQATWFFQIGFILYPPSGNEWDQENHKQMMFITLFFAWHVASVFIFMLLFGSLVYCRVKRYDRKNMYKSMNSSSHSQNGNLMRKLDSEHLMESEEEEI